MFVKRADLLKKVRDCLKDSTGYLLASQVAKICGVSVYRIYTAVRLLKEGDSHNKPLGIHAVKKGYVLSEYASKVDDVEQLRRLNGLRTSIYVTANAAAPHIRPRWNSVADRSAFSVIMKPLTEGGNVLLRRGTKLLLDQSKMVVSKTKAGV